MDDLSKIGNTASEIMPSLSPTTKDAWSSRRNCWIVPIALG
jgi:hypothetical protein